MKFHASVRFVIAVTALTGAAFLPSCSSSSTPAAVADTGTETGSETAGPLSDPDCPADPSTVDKLNPPANCGPDGVSCASGNADVSKCGTVGACLGQSAQSGDVSNLRMSRIRLYAPQSLISVASIAVDPAVNAECLSGQESFNWIIQLDHKNNTIKTGGAKYAADHKSYSFLDGVTVAPADVATICPGFDVGPDTVTLSPVSSPLTLTGGKFKSAVIPKLNVPIFATKDAKLPIVLPLSEAYMQDVTLSADNNCIGSFNQPYSCDGDTGGWKTGGAIIGKMTIKDADHVCVTTGGVRSLCSILASSQPGGSALVGTDAAGHAVCKKGADGSYPEFGDSCVGGTTCKNAITLSATFSAYGINIAAGASTTP